MSVGSLGEMVSSEGLRGIGRLTEWEESEYLLEFF